MGACRTSAVSSRTPSFRSCWRIDPDLKSAPLQRKFSGITPAETLKAMLLPGEIADLSREVERLSGYRRATIEKVKNA